jgi:hypothetical protein
MLLFLGTSFAILMWLDLDALHPFELHEGIKCDMLKFLRVSKKLCQPFLKPTFNLLCKIC